MKSARLLLIAILLITPTACTKIDQERGVWPRKTAAVWYAQQGWLRGCNFIPSTAVNQLEMWQAATFDTTSISRELGYAAGIGFNSVRVYLHHVAWQIDREGFKNRIRTYLAIADRYKISTIFVFFDDCWKGVYRSGPQPAPLSGVHNSRWVQDPGRAIYSDVTLMDTLETYVKDILNAFGKDSRIVLWDLYNEPGNGVYTDSSLALLQRAFKWGRAVNPQQPLSSAVWTLEAPEITNTQIANSDVITYHNYSAPLYHRWMIRRLRSYGRPLICTEYMARTLGSCFQNIMPILKAENIGAYNWGLVAGKTNTIYAWETPIPDGSEPVLWFHDIFRKDGTAYDLEEIKVIKQLSGK
ncbi:MAG TPA: hypothetical protein VM802_17990 [Chitinophaga sp.]|uniref:1,4-beta-xylanase n=1 Tax=Chitinophaga sp. TaxID=1869181 RepID=UPI002C655E9A|nr:1,4-beta-xylanase [Chitinophaga sp.]HVI46775.1 hypothetical protein [Chitinophaga sp.]